MEQIDEDKGGWKSAEQFSHGQPFIDQLPTGAFPIGYEPCSDNDQHKERQSAVLQPCLCVDVCVAVKWCFVGVCKSTALPRLLEFLMELPAMTTTMMGSSSSSCECMVAAAVGMANECLSLSAFAIVFEHKRGQMGGEGVISLI